MKTMTRLLTRLLIWASGLLWSAGAFAAGWPSAADAAPDSLLTQRQENFERFARQNPQERVYLHFDNTSYYKGEHIWFKAYVVDGASLKASDLSRILYVELVNPIGFPVETLKLMVRNGQTSGSFLLKDTLNAGFYEVRAYTAWMLNFTPGVPPSVKKSGDDYGHGWDRLSGILAQDFYGERFQEYLRGNAGIFSRVFPIYDRVENGQYGQKRMPRLPKATASLLDNEHDKLKIDFYPEGGNLVRGVPTRVAFQARSTEGRTLNIEGRLLRDGKEMGTFKTDYAGRGVFGMTSDESDEAEDELMRGLKLSVAYEGRDYTFRLPRAHRRGYVLNVFSTGEDSLRASVARNSLTEGMRLGLSVTSRGTTLYYNVLDMTAAERVSVVVDKASLQTGVNIFTLFTEEGKVLAQREVFVNNHDMDGLRLRVSMPEEGTTLKPYEQVTLDCQLVDADGNAVRERNKLSMAITDGLYRDGTYADGNVLSYLLLGSEVKGFIPHPEYYFEADDREHRTALDLLMMVQGWTRYDFERMMSGERWDPLMAVERGLNFRGRVVDDHGEYEYLLWKNLKKPMWVFNELITPYDGVVSAEIRTDSLGFFTFNLNPFFGTSRMALTLNEQSAEVIGMGEAGVAGHNFSVYKNRRPGYLLGKHVIPMNAYSPVARNYDYYETRALNEPVDPNIFRNGYMAMNKTSAAPFTYYDRRSQAYVLPEVTKTKRRGWADFRGVKPAAVIDVRHMMSYLSNIFGTINDFDFNTHLYEYHDDDFRLIGQDMTKGGWWQPDEAREGLYQNNFADDRFFADMEQVLREAKELKPSGQNAGAIAEATIAGKEARPMRDYNKWHTYKDYKFDQAFRSYHNFYKLLMLMGLDGMNLTFIDAPEYGQQTVFREPGFYGRKENLAPGMQFFPADVNFSKLYLYADADDRRLIHQEGRYREVMTPYFAERSKSNTSPLTSIINFKTDPLYPAGLPQPDFYGYRIDFQGLSDPDEFYRVDYSLDPLPEEGDYRRTLYWNPSLVTDNEGHVRVSFWNNGFTESIAVSAEGVTPNGFITKEVTR